MDGIRMREIMLRKQPCTRLLFMSGSCADAIVESYGPFDRGADFIGKPFSINQFIGKVRAFLHQ